MLSPDEVTQTTDALEQTARTVSRRSAPSERRQNILQQKQTDSLPALSLDTPNAKLAWRQVTLLREENRHLRFELEAQRAEVQRMIDKYDAVQYEHEQEIAGIRDSHQQEIAQYQSHLQQMTDERNSLHEAQVDLKQHQQELSPSFQQAVEEEVGKRVADLAHEISIASDQAPALLQDVVKELERQAKEEGDRYLAEAVYLKREATRMITTLEQERQELATQRQEIYAWQHNMSQQVELRQKTLHDRLHARWRVASLLTTLGVVAVLIMLQFLCLSLLHIAIAGPTAFALIAPIVICVACSFVLTKPVTMLNHMLKSTPHLKKVKKR